MSTGKWNDPSVPKGHWTCVAIVDEGEDGEELTVTCEMCEARLIRYVHVMEHARYETLHVGCICAGHMEGSPDAARAREADFRKRQAQAIREAKRQERAKIKAEAAREKRWQAWLNRAWITTPSGQRTALRCGCHVLVFNSSTANYKLETAAGGVAWGPRWPPPQPLHTLKAAAFVHHEKLCPALRG